MRRAADPEAMYLASRGAFRRLALSSAAPMAGEAAGAGAPAGVLIPPAAAPAVAPQQEDGK